MYNYFIERVKSNLHVVLAMSPIGDAFRNRLRMFPSLINCCTIDWFQVSSRASLLLMMRVCLTYTDARIYVVVVVCVFVCVCACVLSDV